MNILCFGDSNTWGFDADNLCRFPKEVRWTNKLCEHLGPEYQVFEFGICDMTFGTDDPFYKSCNGIQNIIPAIRATSPLDYVIISLGINDCKRYHCNSVEKILDDAGRLIFLIQGYSDLNTERAQVIVCGQCVPTIDIPRCYPREFDSASVCKIYQLNRELRRFCNTIDVPFIDPPVDMKFCKDGGHYSKEGHEIFAKNVAEYIESL